MNKEFLDALTELEREKNISKEDIITAIEDAVELAYKKNYGNYPNVRVSVDREDGEVLVLMSKEVVEDVEDDMMEVSLEEARSYDSRYELGDIIEYQVDPKDFGRIAAQTAKQVVVQRIREAERRNSYDEFVNKQGEIITAKNQQRNYVPVGWKFRGYSASIRTGEERVFQRRGSHQGIRNRCQESY